MAILAVLVAAVSLLGHRAHTEELLHQTKPPTNGPTIRPRISAGTPTSFSSTNFPSSRCKTPIRWKSEGKVHEGSERYRDEQKDIEAEAKKAEDEVKLEGRRADRFDLGEVMLEAALVICSITLLTRKRFSGVLGSGARTLAGSGRSAPPDFSFT